MLPYLTEWSLTMGAVTLQTSGMTGDIMIFATIVAAAWVVTLPIAIIVNAIRGKLWP